MEIPEHLRAIVGLALAEDVGAGDWTTQWTVPEGSRVGARIVAKAHGVVAGTAAAAAAFALVDGGLAVRFSRRDGDAVAPGDEIARIEGEARGILVAERVALNFLQRLSGVATVTREYVRAVEGTGARVLDTRKTTPGMRHLEKAAVLAGGGANHRHGLFDMVLIKENHIRAAGGIAAAVAAVRKHNREGLKVEVEATDLDEVAQAVAARVDRILLDNMPLSVLREAVAAVRASGAAILTEASGGVTLETIRGIAETGVDFVSVGALTHSAPALDLSLLVDLGGAA